MRPAKPGLNSPTIRAKTSPNEKGGFLPLKEVEAVPNIWKLREGKVLVVEDASTASLVKVARNLKDRDD